MELENWALVAPTASARATARYTRWAEHPLLNGERGVESRQRGGGSLAVVCPRNPTTVCAS